MDKQTVENILQAKLDEYNLFLVELNMGANGVITVYADVMPGLPAGSDNITVDQCTQIARHLRSELGEAADNFEITVSSPGLDEPFRHMNQYKKSIGKSVEVLTKEGNKMEGKISTVDENEIVINLFKKRNPKNKALKPEVSDQMVTVALKDIKQTKKLIII
jgi:ribosome maturation factor RimP